MRMKLLIPVLVIEWLITLAILVPLLIAFRIGSEIRERMVR